MYKIVYLSCFVFFLRVNNLSRLDIDIILQDVFFLKNINSIYRHKDKF
jgi:hypothetical protein